jgi:hypothetical protein
MVSPSRVPANTIVGLDPGELFVDPTGRQDLQDHYDPLRPSMPARPYSGSETQAPDRARKGDGLFRATQGTRQQPS